MQPPNAAIHGSCAFCLVTALTTLTLASAERNAALPGPLLPADNWWNQDVSQAPVDARSAQFIAFINNGGTRRLHPDFGGYESPGSVNIYGFPYVVVAAINRSARCRSTTPTKATA